MRIDISKYSATPPPYTYFNDTSLSFYAGWHSFSEYLNTTTSKIDGGECRFLITNKENNTVIYTGIFTKQYFEKTYLL